MSTVAISKEDNLQKLLQFVAPIEREAYPINFPSRSEEYAYASDNYSVIRMPLTDLPEDFMVSEGTHPNVIAVFNDDIIARSNFNTRVCSQDKQISCYRCNGWGRIEDSAVKVTCSDCLGTGESKCPECGHVGTCTVCDGVGKISAGKRCNVCEGGGSISTVTIDGVYFTGYFLQKVERVFGSVRWGLSSDRKLAVFIGDDVCGCVMRTSIHEKA